MSEVRAKKALGQHFLVDLNIARKICDALSGGVRPEAGAETRAVAAGSADADAETRTRVAGYAGAGAEARTMAAGSADAGAEARTKATGTADADAETRRGVAASADARLAADTTAAGAPAAAEEERGGAVPCDVLEVGCGMGVLTQFLLRRGDITTYGAEIDPESVEYLHAHFPEFAPRLIEGDFLKMNLRERFPRGLKIIGNFPYNISSQIFFKVLEHPRPGARMRRYDPEGGRRTDRGASGVEGVRHPERVVAGVVRHRIPLYGQRNGFQPPPKVKSAVIRLRRNSVGRLGCDEALFVKVVKASFGQRRKMIRNSLRTVFGDFGGAEHPFFTQRAEQLSVADFVQLTNWVAANRK